MKRRPTRYDEAGNRHEPDAADDLAPRPRHRGKVPPAQARTPGENRAAGRVIADDAGNLYPREDR